MLFRPLYRLLKQNEKRKAFFILCLMLFGMGLEVFGIGIILPATSMLVNKDGILLGSLYSYLPRDLIELESQSLFFIIMSFLLFVYIFKACFLSFLIYRQTSYAFDLQASLSKRLFQQYLSQEYIFFTGRNSSELIRNVTGEVNIFTFGFVLPFMLLVTEVLVLTGLLFLMLIVHPAATFWLVVSIGFIVTTYHLLVRNKISKWGEVRQEHETYRIDYVQRGVGAIKLIKLMNKYDYFEKNYETSNSMTAKMGEKQKSLAQLPRVWLEFLAVAGLFIVLTVLISEGSGLDDVLPVVSLFVAASLRLLPSFTRILASVHSIRFTLPVITKLDAEMLLGTNSSSKTKSSIKRLSFKKSFCIRNLSFSYPGSDGTSINSIDIEIKRGQSVGFFGPSGAGKSTLVDAMLGLLEPTSGFLLLDKVPIDPSNIASWQSKLGYVPQSIYLMDDTLRRNIAFGVKDAEIDDKRVWSVLRNVGMDDFVLGLPNGLETRVGERGGRLSGGQVQRLGICRALYPNPQVLLLDEATSALDTKTEAQIMRSIYRLKDKLTLIIITHRLTTLSQCETVYKLSEGSIVWTGRPNDIQ